MFSRAIHFSANFTFSFFCTTNYIYTYIHTHMYITHIHNIYITYIYITIYAYTYFHYPVIDEHLGWFCFFVTVNRAVAIEVLALLLLGVGSLGHMSRYGIPGLYGSSVWACWGIFKLISWNWNSRWLWAVFCGYWELNWGHLEEQCILFSTGPSFQIRSML